MGVGVAIRPLERNSAVHGTKACVFVLVCECVPAPLTALQCVCCLHWLLILFVLALLGVEPESVTSRPFGVITLSEGSGMADAALILAPQAYARCHDASRLGI